MLEMGSLAVERLISKTNDELTENKVFKKKFHTKLIIRESCGALIKIGDW